MQVETPDGSSDLSRSRGTPPWGAFLRAAFRTHGKWTYRDPLSADASTDCPQQLHATTRAHAERVIPKSRPHMHRAERGIERAGTYRTNRGTSDSSLGVYDDAQTAHRSRHQTTCSSRNAGCAPFHQPSPHGRDGLDRTVGKRKGKNFGKGLSFQCKISKSAHVTLA